MSLNTFTANPNTGEAIHNQDNALTHKLWAKKCEFADSNNDFFRQFEGRKTSSPVVVERDTSKGAGQEITFPKMSGFYSEAHFGSDLFVDGTHFEKIRMGSDKLKVDWVRHAIRHDLRLEELVGMRGEIVSHIPEQLGEWLGRLKTDQMFMMFLHGGDSTSYHVINNRASIAKIRRTDTLSYSAVLEYSAAMQNSSGFAAQVGQDAAGNPIHKYIVVGSSDALFSLDADPSYLKAKESAGVRGNENWIFSGGFAPLRGQIIREYTSKNHDGVGPVGSPITPRAELGDAITSGTTTFNITGGGNDTDALESNVRYFKHFPNYAYKFADGSSLIPSGTAFYVAVINTSGANTGKFGFYECTTNDGTKLTVSERLASSASGIAKTAVGNVKWDAAVNTDAHPEGSLVVLCSEDGAPLGATIWMGRACARRGYGKYERERRVQKHEGGFVNDVHIWSVFGQAPNGDRKGRTSGFKVVWHAVQIPGVVLEPALTDNHS